MIVLGIDPGSRITGYGLVSFRSGTLAYVDSGVFRTQNKTFPERLKDIYRGVSSLFTRFDISEAAIEQVFMHKNADAALKLGQARGAAVVAMVDEDIPVAEYSARQIKQSVVGTGKADKTQVSHMVSRLLGINNSFITADESDALAVAICHTHMQSSYAKLLLSHKK